MNQSDHPGRSLACAASAARPHDAFRQATIGSRSLLERAGYVTIRKDPVISLVLRVPLQRLLSPLVLVRGMIKHEIHHQRDPRAPQFLGQILQLFHRPQVFADVTVARYGVASIVQRLRDFEDGHEVEVGEAEFFEVWDLCLDALEVVCVQVDLHLISVSDR